VPGDDGEVAVYGRGRHGVGPTGEHRLRVHHPAAAARGGPLLDLPVTREALDAMPPVLFLR
jgi:hypothetical protein